MHAYLTERTLSGLFFKQAEKFKGDPFLWSKEPNGVKTDKYESISWEETARQVKALGAALIELGLCKGDRAAIFSQNGPRWMISDQAIQAAGGLGVPIYPTSTNQQLGYILKDCGARMVMVGDEKLLQQVLDVKGDAPALDCIVALFPLKEKAGESVISYDDALKKGGSSSTAAAELEARRADLSADDDAAIIYTSGTTGEPKGAILTQSNFMAETEMLLDSTITNKMVEQGIRLLSLCHLPLCHIYGRTAEYHVLMAMGGQIYFAESYQAVPRNLREVRPQMLITIPRLYEKVYEMVLVTSSRMTGARKTILDWSLRVGARVVDCMSSGKRLPPWLAIQFALAGTLVYDKVRKEAGLDRLVFATSGGGALPEEINRFFRAMNLQIGEGYGLTETCSAVSWNSLEFIEKIPDNWLYAKALDYLIDTMVVMQSQGTNPFAHPVGIFKLLVATNLVVHRLVQKPGTVGRPCKNTEIKLAEDGEILVKGPQIFKREKGYFNKPEMTDEAFNEEGYFLTGDIGEFDEDGFLRITDRKKELIVTAGGKNIAPHPIEMLLALDTMIEQACVIGDARKYLSALLVPQFELLERWARDKGIKYSSMEELLARPETIEMFDEKVKKVNEQLARYEQIKYYRLLPAPFAEETGELTPTQKIKRRVINVKYKREIESLYEH